MGMHGKGREKDSLGNIYDGWWSNGLYSGLGRQVTQDGHIYYGLWRSGIKNQKGVHLYP